MSNVTICDKCGHRLLPEIAIAVEVGFRTLGELASPNFCSWRCVSEYAAARAGRVSA